MADKNPWHLTETYKGLITLSIETLKILALINGGAAVAVLTYIGNARDHDLLRPALPHVKFALILFCAGVAFVALAFILAYLTQLFLFNEEVERDGGRTLPRCHFALLWTAIILCVLSVGSFFCGCVSAANALISTT